MKKLILSCLLSLVIFAPAYAQVFGVVDKGPEDPMGIYTGQYKYPNDVTYIDYRGNQVTGTGWVYVSVSGITLSNCQSALQSASSWGATITQGCSL
jgi:hypothetical protein